MLNQAFSPRLYHVVLGLLLLSIGSFDLRAESMKGLVVPIAGGDSLQVRFFAKVHAGPDSDSPLLGMAGDEWRSAVLEENGPWRKVSFRNGTGWIRMEVQAALPLPLPQELNDESATRSTTTSIGVAGSRRAMLLWASAIAFAIGLTAAGLYYLNRKRSGNAPTEPPKENRRTVLLVAREEKIIHSETTSLFFTLAKCLEDLGFGVKMLERVEELPRALSQIRPAALGIDYVLDPELPSKLEKALGEVSYWRGILFLYNVPKPAALKPPPMLRNAHFLGESFRDRELFGLLVPLLDTPVREGADQPLLEGRLGENHLFELLQFLEVGRKTGLLTLDAAQPLGLIHFQEGVITLAQTPSRQGKAAVFELLRESQGRFQFFGDKRCPQVNCRLNPTQLLLEFTRLQDESGQMAVRRAD